MMYHQTTYADAAYVRWFAAQQGLADTHHITLYSDDGRLYAHIGDKRRVELGLSPCEWQARVKAARERAGLEKSNRKRDYIKVGGITVRKRWAWTKAREQEERDNVLRLSRGSGCPNPTKFADEKHVGDRTP